MGSASCWAMEGAEPSADNIRNGSANKILPKFTFFPKNDNQIADKLFLAAYMNSCYITCLFVFKIYEWGQNPANLLKVDWHAFF